MRRPGWRGLKVLFTRRPALVMLPPVVPNPAGRQGRFGGQNWSLATKSGACAGPECLDESTLSRCYEIAHSHGAASRTEYWQ